MAFQIKDKIETENKTIRFPIPIIKDIEKQIENKNISFSKFVIEACKYALDNIEDNKEPHKTHKF